MYFIIWDELSEKSHSHDENVNIVNNYIKLCTELIVPTKFFVVFVNHKPWLTGEVKEVIHVYVNKKKRALLSNRTGLRRIQVELNLS